jgi:hypothetical protein
MTNPPFRNHSLLPVVVVKAAVHVLVVIRYIAQIPLLLSSVQGYSLLNGVMVTPAPTVINSNNNMKEHHEEAPIDLGQWLLRLPSTAASTEASSSSSSVNQKRTLLIFGTYAADFNMIEYGQRIRYYYPILQKSPYNITRCGMIINGKNSLVVQKFRRYIDLPDTIEYFYDPTGKAGKAFGVSRGWLPDNPEINPYLKLFGMLFGLGAYATLPAVISGYIGNPFVQQPWITDALTVGNLQQRWPMNALEINNGTTVIKNKFDDLPVVGRTWGRRPLELATLRLQSMMGISIAHWDELQPNQQALDAGVLTQLGGCLIIEQKDDNDSNDHGKICKILYDWKDPGICAVANFEDILKKLQT